MKKQQSSTDARSSRYSFRHSFSLTSLLGSSSRSPESTRKVLNNAQNESKNSFVSVGSSSKLATETVRAEDFADSDSSMGSQYSDEEVRTAESIYSVIREYEPQRQSFWFNEEFDRSDESYQTTELPTEKHSSSLPYSTPEEEGPSFQSDSPLNTGMNETRSTASTGNAVPASRFPMLQSRASRNFRGPHTQILNDQLGNSLPEPDVSPLVDSNTTGTFAYTAPQVLDSVDEHEVTKDFNSTSLSLSSGELLSRLDGSVHTSNRNSVSSEIALQTLIAGVDLDGELPVMVYSVHDQQTPSARWSVYEKQPLASPAHFQRHPPAIPVQMRDGTNLRRVSVSSRSNSSTSRNASPRSMVTAPSVSRAQSLSGPKTGSSFAQRRGSSGRYSAHRLSTSSYAAANSTSSSGSTSTSNTSGRNSSSTPGVFSNVSTPIPENQPIPHAGNMLDDERQTRSMKVPQVSKKPSITNDQPKVVTKVGKPYVASPAASVTRDSGERKRYHESMFRDEEKDIGIHTQHHCSPDMPWTKWVCMMVMALVAVPVFFLIPLGAFDHGGFSRPSDRPVPLSEKAVLVNWRYMRKYTKSQKLASLVLGLVWISIVLSMIAVGFGVSLRGR